MTVVEVHNPKPCDALLDGSVLESGARPEKSDRPSILNKLSDLVLLQVVKAQTSASYIDELTASVREDQKNSGQAAKVSGAGRLITKAAGVVSAPDAALGYIGVTVLERTGSPIAVACSAAAANVGWSLFAGSTTNAAIEHYPKTSKHFAKSFPRFTNKYDSMLPGLHDFGSKPDDTRSLAQKLSARLSRGVVSANRLTPYVSAAGRSGYDYKERRRLMREAVIDGTAIKGPVYGVIGLGVTALNGANPHAGDIAQSLIKNPLTWSALGILAMSKEYIKNRRIRRKAAEHV